MKIFGYDKDNNENLIELSEVSLIANPERLRSIATFLNKCANEIESQGSEWEHEHYSETNENMAGTESDLIVCNSENV